MSIAVISLTRDRLEYTQHCFDKLREFAGCEFDHYVWDNGSQDGTFEWLEQEFDDCQIDGLYGGGENVGISRAMNAMLDMLKVMAPRDYDVIVKFDNDCELTEPDTLRRVAELTVAGNAFLSPRILGLNNPPASTGTFYIDDEPIWDIPQIGGIFLAAPASVYEEYRYPEDGPTWGMDDAHICHWFRGRGGRCGYVEALTANHYEGTSGQWERYPEYFQRTLAEGKPSL